MTWFELLWLLELIFRTYSHDNYSIANRIIFCQIQFKHEAIMLQNLSIKLMNSAPKIVDYAIKKMPIIPKIMPLILANNVSL